MVTAFCLKNNNKCNKKKETVTQLKIWEEKLRKKLLEKLYWDDVLNKIIILNKLSSTSDTQNLRETIFCFSYIGLNNRRREFKLVAIEKQAGTVYSFFVAIIYKFEL